jgi:hypothetical protein
VALLRGLAARTRLERIVLLHLARPALPTATVAATVTVAWQAPEDGAVLHRFLTDLLLYTRGYAHTCTCPFILARLR